MPCRSSNGSTFRTKLCPFKPTEFSLRRDVRLKQQEAIKAKTVAGGLAECRKLLVDDIRGFRVVQKVYMPGLSHLLDDTEDDSRFGTRPEAFKLMLPSQLSPDERTSWCLPDLSTLEARFRYAQADGALAEICRLRQLFQGLSDQTRKHITNSQSTGRTRSQGTFDRYNAQISRFAAVYRNARRALVALDPEGKIVKWTSRFLELNDGDIRGPGRETDEPSDGHTVSSWIWLVPKASQPLDIPRPANVDTNTPNEQDLSQRAASGEEVAVSIRAHWARCQARAERHEEEVELTLEEMRRTIEFFKWKSRWWLTLKDARVNSAEPPDPQVQHGLRAYAHRQASIYSSLAVAYANHWRKFLVDHSLGTEWLSQTPATPPPANDPIPTVDVDGPLEGDEDEDDADPGDPTDPEFEEIFADLHGN